MIQNSLITDMVINPDLLRSFVAVVHSGAFQVAADQVGRTPAAVSMQIKRLEEQVGTPLMDRNNRGIRLTPAGQRLLTYAERLLRLNNEALAAIHDPAVAGRIHIGFPAEYSDRLLGQLLPVLRNRFPALKPRITAALSRDLRRLLHRGELDLAIVTREPSQPKGELLATEALSFWQSEDLAEGQVPLPLVVFGDDCPMRDLPLTRLKQAGIAFETVFSANSTDALVEAVDNGIGIGLLPNNLCTGRPGLHPAKDKRLPTNLSVKTDLICAETVNEEVQAAIIAATRTAFPQS